MRWAIVIAAVALARPAAADDEIVTGSVVKIEAKEIYVSVGTERGIAAGAPLRIKRTISLKHPVTGASVQDWIPIASATVTQAGGALSRAVVGDLVAEIKVGDLAEVLIARAAPARPHPAVPAPDVDPATAEVLAVFTAQVGQPLEARIAGWERYLSMRGGSPYADAIHHDLDALRALRDQMRAPSTTEGAAAIASVEHGAPHTAPAHTPLVLAFVLDEPQRIASAYLHYRTAGAQTYHRVLLEREHDIYLRGIVPPEAVAPPGVEYFVEVATPTGATGLALASPEQPVAVEVAGPPLLDAFAPTPGRSSVHIAFDYLDFSTFDKRTIAPRDHVAHATVDFTYRLLAGKVESFGVGYGVYGGRGGFVMTPGPYDEFHYGYASIELGDHPDPRVHLAAGGSVIAGVGKTGFGMGVEGHIRIGDRDATNLLLSGSTVDQVGFLSEVRFGTRPIDDFLFGVSVGATNQPNDGDVGVKLGVDAELVRYKNATISVGTSWQGRSTDHGGLGGGAGLGVSW